MINVPSIQLIDKERKIMSRQIKVFVSMIIVLGIATGCGKSEPENPSPTTINTWIRRFEGNDYGAFFDITLTEDGNVLAVGATNHRHVPPYSGDALLMKLNLEGDLLWKKTWGGDGYEQAWSVVPADDGGYYVFGETDSYGAGDRDFFLLKITGDGAEEWFQTYGNKRREWPYGMIPLSNRDLLLYGFTEAVDSGDRNQYAIRVDPKGDIVWEYIVESSTEEFVLDAIESAGGDLILAVGIAEDGELVRLAPDGKVLWTKRYELAGWQFGSQVIQTGDGGGSTGGFFDEHRLASKCGYLACPLQPLG